MWSPTSAVLVMESGEAAWRRGEAVRRVVCQRSEAVDSVTFVQNVDGIPFVGDTQNSPVKENDLCSWEW